MGHKFHMCQITSFKILHMNDYLLMLWLSLSQHRTNKFNFSLVSRSKQVACMLKKKMSKVFMSTNQGRLLKIYCSCKLFTDTYILIEWGTNIIFHWVQHSHPWENKTFHVYLLTLFLFFCSSKRLFRLEISSSFLSTFPCNSAITSSFTFNLQNHPTENQIK